MLLVRLDCLVDNGEVLDGKDGGGEASVSRNRDILKWFKSHGPGYRTRINAVLRAYKDAVEWRNAARSPQTPPANSQETT